MEEVPVDMEAQAATRLGALGSQNLHEFVRYFSASAVALVADAGSLVVMTSMFGVPYLISGAISFTFGLIVIYVLSVAWVFDKRSLHHPAAEFLIFAGIGIAGLLINEGVLALLTGIFGLFYVYSKIASVVVVFSWNYLVRKFVLFSGSSHAAH